MQDKHDAAIDRTLAALNEARPPDGMEARIQQRLQYHTAQANVTEQTWRPAKTWWMGALAGAAVATLICVIGWLGLSGRTNRTVARNAPTAAPAPRVVDVVKLPVEAPTARPCAEPAVRREASHPKEPVLMRAAAESPKPASPEKNELTPQERELVRLAQVAGPQELSAMTSEARARADAQQAAAFKQFFTPPPPPPHDEGENE